jgi:transcriptional regulator with XRE-family HTH domain
VDQPTSDPRKLLGQRIRELRARQGVTQEELADRCDMFRTYLSRIESGQANPTLTALHVLARGLEVSVPELLSPPEMPMERVRVQGAQPVSRGRVRR